MISEISKIKNVGIFGDFKWSNGLNPFGKYNLIYGWNGSGKTTLSKVFRMLETKNVDFLDTNGEVSFKINGSTVSSKNLESWSGNLFVFNEEFLNENIDWDESIKSILLLSKEHITDWKEIEKKEKEFEVLAKKIESLSPSINKQEKAIEKFLSSTAKNLKEKFQILDVSDKKYMNYNRSKLQKFIDDNVERLKDKSGILSETQVATLTLSSKPSQKNKIEISIAKFDDSKIEKAINRVKELLNTKVTSNVIESLKKDKSQSEWVEKGLNIHNELGIKSCLFCGNAITNERIIMLEEHFNDKYTELQQLLDKAIDWLEGQKYNFEAIESNKFYDEFEDDVIKIMKEFTENVQAYNNIIDNLVQLIEQKKVKPFESLTIGDIAIDVTELIKIDINKLDDLVKQHNHKFSNYQSEVGIAKSKLELHYNTVALDDYDYFNLFSEIGILNNDLLMCSKKKETTKKNLLELQAKLSNEALGATEFNAQLSKFIGHSEISLHFNTEINGYEILRNGSKKASNLSEGEKTAIAFIYFLTKIQENNNKIKDSIIILDDPISSFDSNNMFHSYSYIRDNLNGSKQLFILTHNFGFYRLIRDWILKKNKKDKPLKSHLFTIEVCNKNGRCSSLANADSSLITYHSEYHYLFCKLYKCKTSEKLSLDESFMISNMSRKLLEGFLNFKFPKSRNDFYNLMQEAVKDEKKRERVYRFINKYSHNNQIDFESGEIDNLLSESGEIINDVLEIIEHLDPIHFSEMKSIAEGV